MCTFDKLDNCNNRICMCLSSLRVLREAINQNHSTFHPETLVEAIMLIEFELEKNIKEIEDLIEEMK